MAWSVLNVFQRLVQQWDDLHPYNAAQVLQLGAAPDVGRANEAWHEMLAELGLGRVRRRGPRYRFECLNGDTSLFAVPRYNSDTTLSGLMSQQLNCRFCCDRDLPVRPFVLAADGSAFVGVIYHHWVADSASIRILLREWFFRLYDPARARRTPLRMPQTGYWQSFGPMQGRWRLGEGVLGSLRWSSRMKRVRRVESPQFHDYRTHFLHRPVPKGLATSLRAAAREYDATLNDVFMAAAAEICDRLGLMRRTPRRQDLALGTIVDLRARSRAGLDDVFGLFLGFTSVVCRPRDFEDFNHLLRRISTQNRLHKHNGVPEASMVRMLAGLVAHRALGSEQIKEFYRKRIPLAGGVSNVNMSGSWVEQYHPYPILDFMRVAPCGPMMPLVFTPTTIGERMNLGLTCRQSLISADQAERISSAFLERLSRFAGAQA